MTEKIIPIPPPPPNPPIDQVPRPPAGNKTTDYYTTKKKKIVDFFIGFVGIIVLYLVLAYLFGMLSSVSAVFSSFSGILMVGALVVAIIISRNKGRRFIGLGILWAIIIPVIVVGLLLGACFLALGRSGGF